MYIYIFLYIHTHTHIYIYIYIYICVYIPENIYTYIFHLIIYNMCLLYKYMYNIYSYILSLNNAK